MYHRKRNYVLGAGQPPVEVYTPPLTFRTLLSSMGVTLMLGGAALGYFTSRPAHRVRNAAIGAAAAFAVGYFWTPAVPVDVPDDQLPEMEEEF